MSYLLVGLRGLINRCPNCGEGRLLASYLKPVENCAVCGEHLGQIRADDGPAWLTILLVGHILAPIMLSVVPNSSMPDSLAIPMWLLIASALVLLILPRAKGIFIGILWKMA